jgi:hypothetical protein
VTPSLVNITREAILSRTSCLSGCFSSGTGSHSYLEFDLLETADPGALVQAIANLREPRTTTGGVNLVVGFRPSLWRRVAPQEMPVAATDARAGRAGCGRLYDARPPT